MTSSHGRIESINTSRGGVPKTAVGEAHVSPEGVEGDRQRLLLFHGGPKRAVSLYSLDLIRALQDEGHPIATGTAGENLTVSGLDWAAVAPGRELRIGPVHLVITAYASPCIQIRESFQQGAYARIAHKRHPGWSRVYAQVLTGGRVRVGDAVTLS